MESTTAEAVPERLRKTQPAETYRGRVHEVGDVKDEDQLNDKLALLGMICVAD